MPEAIIYYDVNITPERLRLDYGLESLITYPNFGLFNLELDQIDTLDQIDGLVVNLINYDQLQLGGHLLDKELMKFSAGGGKDRRVWLIQFAGPIKEEWKTELEDYGVQLYGYLHPYTMFAYMPVKIATKLAHKQVLLNEEPAVHWVGRYNKTYKLPRTPLTTGKTVVHFFPWSKHDQHEIMDNTEGGEDSPTIQMVDSEEVLLIEPYYVPELLNSESRQILKSYVCHDSGCIGTDQVVAITDTGIYQNHEAFLNMGKLSGLMDLAGDSSASGGDGHGHGTHVAGSVGGQTIPYLDYSKDDGQAYGSKLYSIKVFNNAGAWATGVSEYTFWKNGYLAGAPINNNSWGAGTAGAYTSLDRNADLITSEYQDYVLTIAAGNAGPSVNTLNSPGGSKNSITVGATSTSSPNNLGSFSSRGPTQDNRIKPDILAPGFYIQSAQAGTATGYVSLYGTSMATPQISGLSALVKQHLEDNSVNPSASLIKGLLINGAEEITGNGADSLNEGTFPNSSQGWGQANIERSLPYLSSRQIEFWDPQLAPQVGSSWTETITVPEYSTRAKITLVWTDEPGLSGSNPALVNNLNLKVTGPSGEVFWGNVFSGLNPGYSVTGGSLDQINNVEGVHLLSESFNQPSGQPIPSGTYQIEVISSSLLVNHGFSVVAGVDLGEAPPTKIALVGDYMNQMKTRLESAGYEVDSYGYTQADQISPNSYAGIIINKISNNSDFDILVNSGTGLMLLGPYPLSTSGLGVLSNRTNNPVLTTSLWNKGAVQVKVVSEHQIFGSHPLNTVLTLVNGGDNDYQSYDSYGTLLGQNEIGPGYPGIIGLDGNHLVIGGLGLTSYTNANHWTSDGEDLFLKAVEFIST